MGTADQVVKFFEYSPKKQKVLEEMIENAITCQSTRTKLKELCRTRWVERHDAFAVFVDLLPAITQALEIFSKQPNTRQPGVADAQSLLNSICNFGFVVCIVVTQRCLGFVKNLSSILQERQLDIGRAMGYVDLVQSSLQATRDDVNDFHSKGFEKASTLASLLDVEIRKPRICGHQTQRDNTPSETVSEYYRKTLTIPFLDHLINEMST